jgi:hypothetical protein
MTHEVNFVSAQVKIVFILKNIFYSGHARSAMGKRRMIANCAVNVCLEKFSRQEMPAGKNGILLPPRTGQLCEKELGIPLTAAMHFWHLSNGSLQHLPKAQTRLHMHILRAIMWV